MEVLDFIEEEDQTTLDAEEKVFDEHVNRVSDIMERLEKLEDLGATTEPLRPHVSTDPKEAGSGLMRNQKRLKYLKTSLDKANATIRLLEPTPALDICLVEKVKKDVDMLTNKLSDIVEDILSLPQDDTASLNEATSMDDELGRTTLKLIKLTHDRERRDHRTMDEASASPGVRLPKISIPTFDGKILSWKSFWEQFDATIHSKAGLNVIEKLTYLQDALKDSPARFMIQGLTRTSTKYITSYHFDYKSRLKATNLLPMSLWLEAQDVMLLIKLMLDPPSGFRLEEYITYMSSSTRASSLNKIKSSRLLTPRLNITRHFFFNRVIRIWNSLPYIDIQLPYSSIKRHILSIFWKYFLQSYSIDNPCSWCIACPCANCSKLPNPPLILATLSSA